jgi:cyclopropane-fatty-acyl-phospholipid synthase
MTAAKSTASRAIAWTEMGLVPDAVIRAGIRRLNRRRLEEMNAFDLERADKALNVFTGKMDRSDIAPLPQLANEQHYEVPAEFFGQVLGPQSKYSCCYWGDGAATLQQAESDALAMSAVRAGIEDGMKVLDLGCGWGSLSLWIARHFPNCSVTAVSNSSIQRKWIQSRIEEGGLSNVRVLTRDMNDFDINERFDRIVSVEMFEHMRNYKELFRRVSNWLSRDGRFFMHIFCHRSVAYEFKDEGPSDWMGRHFFSGGMMPSADLPLRFQQHLQLESRWAWSGRHYERTANAWLANMDERQAQIMLLLEDCYGDSAAQWFQRWRIFFMACAELFATRNGQEWFVSHYLFSRQ